MTISSTHSTEGIEALTTSAAWRSHLEVQGRFHRYSFSNALLIVRQDPDASRVAGFATWKALGRAVRKGERAIWILAPMTGRRTRSADGDEHRPILGFRPVAVFDVAQTDGEPLPEVCRTLEGDDPGRPVRAPHRPGVPPRLHGRRHRAPGHHQR